MSEYVPTDWADGTTPLDEAHLDKIEQGIKAATDKALALDALPKIPTPLVDDRWLRVEGGAMLWADVGAEYQALSAKGQASGYASLDEAGKVPAAQLPPTADGHKHFPIDLRNANVGGAPGGAFPVVVSRSSFEQWAWGFSPTALGVVYGYFRLPENVQAGTGTLRFELDAPVAGNVVLNVTLEAISNGETLNFAAWTWAPGNATVAIPTAHARTLYNAGSITIPTHVAAGDLVIVGFRRMAADAADVNTGVLNLTYAALTLD